MFLIVWVMAISILSCGKYDPMADAVFPCTCIDEDTSSTRSPVMKWQCQYREYHFVNIEYSKKYKVGDIISEPLINK